MYIQDCSLISYYVTGLTDFFVYALILSAIYVVFSVHPFIQAPGSSSQLDWSAARASTRTAPLIRTDSRSLKVWSTSLPHQSSKQSDCKQGSCYLNIVLRILYLLGTVSPADPSVIHPKVWRQYPITIRLVLNPVGRSESCTVAAAWMEKENQSKIKKNKNSCTFWVESLGGGGGKRGCAMDILFLFYFFYPYATASTFLSWTGVLTYSEVTWNGPSSSTSPLIG